MKIPVPGRPARRTIVLAAAIALAAVGCSSSSSSTTGTTGSTSTPAGDHVEHAEHRDGQHVAVRHQARRGGDRHPDRARRHRHQPAGHVLHRHPEHGERVLRLRQRQRRHQRPPDQALHRDRADQPGPDRGRRQAAGADRSRGRHHRQHLHHRVLGGQQLLAEARLLHHRLRDRARVLFDPEQRRRQHGPAVQLGRGGAVRARPARQQDRLRPVERPRHRVHRGRPGRARESRERARSSS